MFELKPFAHQIHAEIDGPPPIPRTPVPDDLEIIAEGLGFPEGPISCPDGSVLVVEVRGGTLTRVTPSGAIEVVAELGGGPNGAAIGPDGAVYVCNNGGLPWSQLDDGSWYPIDLATGTMTPPDYRGGWIERVEPSSGDSRHVFNEFEGVPLSAPNDIAFDRQGRMWFTDTGKTGLNDTVLGAVYRGASDGSNLEVFARGLLGPNGIGFSPDWEKLYVADTPSGRVLTWDVGADRVPQNPRAHGVEVLGRLPGMIAFDSLVVDAMGRVIVAMPGAGGLAVVHPNGGIWMVDVPDPLPTNACFGGADGRTLYVTLGGHGRLARFRWPCPGARLPFQIRSSDSG